MTAWLRSGQSGVFPNGSPNPPRTGLGIVARGLFYVLGSGESARDIIDEHDHSHRCCHSHRVWWIHCVVGAKKSRTTGNRTAPKGTPPREVSRIDCRVVFVWEWCSAPDRITESLAVCLRRRVDCGQRLPESVSRRGRSGQGCSHNTARTTQKATM